MQERLDIDDPAAHGMNVATRNGRIAFSAY